jgi:hypothetical protein
MLDHLWSGINFNLSEVLRIDFWLGLAAGGGGAAIAVIDPSAALRGDAIASGLVGVILGAVIAGVSVQAAFMDQAFLQKLRDIGREPIRYLAPFIFTAVIGVFAMLGLIVLALLSDKSNKVLLGIATGITGFFSIWTIVSLLYCLATLVQFMGLKMDALPAQENGSEDQDG